MRVVVQRVKSANVKIDGDTVGEIGSGLVLLIGFAMGDKNEDMVYVMDKCVHLRIFSDDDGKMNLSLKDIGGKILAVSQFTLYGDTRKGRRPGFDKAAPPDISEPMYEAAVRHLRLHGISVSTGRFGAHMRVSLVNDGPVTLIVESK